MYSFLFDRRSMALLLFGLVAAAILLFAGGLFVGLKLQLDSSASAMSAPYQSLSPSQSAAIARAEPYAPPAAKPPPLEAPGAQPSAVSEPQTEVGAEDPESPEDGPPEQPIATIAALPAAEPPNAPVAPTTTATGTLQVRAALPTAEPLPVVESVEVLSHGELSGGDGEQDFGVQVAAFELRSTASRIAAELTDRGWDTYLVPFETSSGRQMFSIRFGRFSERSAAYRAAREFEERENAPALVRLQSPED